MPERHVPRRGQRWTPAEDIALLAAPPGTSHRELATRLGRTPGSVSDRVRLLHGRLRAEATANA